MLGEVVLIEVVDVLVYGGYDDDPVSGAGERFEQGLPEVVDVPATVGHYGYGGWHVFSFGRMLFLRWRGKNRENC